MNSFVSKQTVLFTDLLHSRLSFLQIYCASVVTRTWKFMASLTGWSWWSCGSQCKTECGEILSATILEKSCELFSLSLFLYSAPVWHKSVCQVNFLHSLSVQTNKLQTSFHIWTHNWLLFLQLCREIDCLRSILPVHFMSAQKNTEVTVLNAKNNLDCSVWYFP